MLDPFASGGGQAGYGGAAEQSEHDQREQLKTDHRVQEIAGEEHLDRAVQVEA